jgi:hypothetical protein
MANLLVHCSLMTPPSIFTLQIPESVNYEWKINKGKLELDGCGSIVTLNSNYPPSPGQNKLTLQKSEGKWSQEWVAISRDVVLLQDDGRETQEWTAQFVDPPYQYGLLPQQSFPGVVRVPTIKRVKLQQTTGTWITIFELQIFDPTDQNIALSGTASASSAYTNADTASKAIDGNMQTIYHSKNAQEGDPAPWLQIDLPASYEAHKIIIHNRGCGDEVKDQCLCRLSYANLLLYDESGAVVSSISTGDTCGIATLTYGPKDLLPCCGSCLSSALDQEVSKTAMHYCDMSMSLLLGSTTSLGSLRAIKDEVVSKGLDYLPGRCCFDKPTTQDAYFGVYVSSEMKLLYCIREIMLQY